MSDLGTFGAYLRIERGLSAATVVAYSAEVRSFLEFLEPLTAAEASPEDVREWILARPAAPSTVTVRLSAIRAWCKSRRAPNLTEDIDRPKKVKGIPRPVPDLESKLARLGPLDRQRAVFLLETGLRISEACSVEVAIPVPEQLHVRGKGGRERILPLSERARIALTALGGSMLATRRQVQDAFRAAGFTPHQLRHTFACQLIEAGADLGEVQDLLGHESPATTRVYAHYSTTRLRRALRLREEAMAS